MAKIVTCPNCKTKYDISIDPVCPNPESKYLWIFDNGHGGMIDGCVSDTWKEISSMA